MRRLHYLHVLPPPWPFHLLAPCLSLLLLPEDCAVLLITVALSWTESQRKQADKFRSGITPIVRLCFFRREDTDIWHARREDSVPSDIHW